MKIIKDQRRKELLDLIIGFFMDERGEEIGIIAAEAFLDLMLEELTKDLYNKGIDDSLKLFKTRFEDLDTDISILRKD